MKLTIGLLLWTTPLNALRNPYSMTKSVAQDLVFFLWIGTDYYRTTTLSPIIIFRRIESIDLLIDRVSLPFTQEREEMRLGWCQERILWGNKEWNRIVFSDLSQFYLWAHGRRRRVGQIFGHKPVWSKHETALTRVVILWDAISDRGRSWFVLLERNTNNEDYINIVLVSFTLPLFQVDVLP